MTSGAEIRSLEVAQAAESEDYTSGPVPLSARHDPLTMGLLWITMVTGFTTVLIGFQWCNEGLTLTQVVGSSIVSCLVVLAYCVPSCLLGSKSGLTYSLLSRKVFGPWGSWLVSGNLASISIAWYSMTAVFLADGLRGLYYIPVSRVVLSIVLAVVMAFNNFFGFSGIANFAKYVAGPLLIAWVAFTFVKAGASCPAAVWHQPVTVSPAMALTAVSSFIVGYACWGNEADYWRYSKPRASLIVVPLAVALVLGQILFPVTGWMLGHMTHAPNYAAATRIMNDYAFGGVSSIAAIVLFVTYCAANDSNLYGAINSLQNIKPIHRKRMVAGATLFAAALAAFLAGYKKNFESVASLSSIFLPCATTIVLVEYFLQRHLGAHGAFVDDGDEAKQLLVRCPAVIALLAGCTFGLLTCGIFPGLQRWNVGVPSLQSWLVSLVVYLILRGCEIMIAGRRKSQ